MPVDARSLAADSQPLDLAGQIAQQRDAILEQLGRVLASPHFKHSRHYPALLRYVVEQTIEGHTANLKERSLGVDVFHRDPDYDTNLDPVVRTCACEVRKRIAHYYEAPAHKDEIRICLPAGSYHPEFHFPALPSPVPEPHAAPVPVPVIELVAAPSRMRSPWWILLAIGLLPLALAIGAISISATHNPLDQFWTPVFASSDSSLIAISHPGRPAEAGASPTVSEVMANDAVAFSDALAMARLTGLIRSRGKRFDIRRPVSMTLTDLRKSPIILIGGFNNTWTMFLGSHLRFYFERDPETKIAYIRDRKNPARFYTNGPANLPYSRVKEDYAIVSRYLDPLTEKMVVTVAGIGKDGTLAAGEFVTESKYLETLAGRAPADWQHRNLQVVIATEIVNGIPGPPRILDQCFW